MSWTPLESPQGKSTYGFAGGVDAAGDILGGWTPSVSSLDFYPAVWPSDRVKAIPLALPKGFTDGEVSAADAQGDGVGDVYRNKPSRTGLAVWPHGSEPVGLSSPFGAVDEANAIAQSAADPNLLFVVRRITTPSGSRGALWAVRRGGVHYAASSMFVDTLPPLRGDTDTDAYSVNGEGAVVGESYRLGRPAPDCCFHAVLYKNGAVTNLTLLAPPGARAAVQAARAINKSGQIIAGYESVYAANHASPKGGPYVLTPK